jgi:outer membrane protein OmpA-like peptidoglycan-associated protein
MGIERSGSNSRKTKMKKLCILITIAALAASMQAEAGSRATRPGESVGVVSGMIVGVAAAGPFGAVLGGALGAYLGNSVEEAQKLGGVQAELAAARTDLSAASDQLARLRQAQADAERRIDDLVARLEMAPDAGTLGRGIELSVYFRTGEAKTGEAMNRRLQNLAELLARMPDIAVQLDGHADPRGNDHYNRQLSLDRAGGVRKLLLAAGVPEQRIGLSAYGESLSTAADRDMDAYALERRVVIRLVPAGAEGQLAQRD